MNSNIMAFKQRARVGDITTELVLLGVLGVAGWYIFTQMGQSDQSKAQAANNQAAAANTTTANQTTLNQVTATGMKQTLTDSAINNMANSLARLIQAGPDDVDSTGTVLPSSTGADQAKNIVLQVNNVVDWQKLVTQFGTRQDYKNNTVDLVTGLREIIDPATLSNLDSFLYEQGIGWQF